MDPGLLHKRAASVQTQQRLTSQTVSEDCAPLRSFICLTLTFPRCATVLPSKQGVSTLSTVCSLNPVLPQKQKSKCLSFRTGLVCWSFSRLFSVLPPLEACIKGFLSLLCLLPHTSSCSVASGWPPLFVWLRRGCGTQPSKVLYDLGLQLTPPLPLPERSAFLAPRTHVTCS